MILIIQVFPVSTDRGSKGKLIISFLLMFVYTALRGDFANDYISYEKYFKEVHESDFSVNQFGSVEIGYYLLNKIMPSYRALLVLLSAFTCVTYFLLFYKFIPKKFYWLGFALMAISGGNMLFFQMTGLRNAIALNILALSIPLIKNRKILPYTGLTILAYLFHQSAALYMPIVYIFATPNAFRRRQIIVTSMIIVVLFTTSTTSLINNISPIIDSYFERYIVYLDKASGITQHYSILMIGFILLTISLTFNILIREKLSDNENIIMKLSLLFLISFVLGLLNIRMSQYFAPFLVIGTTVVMSRVRNMMLKYTYLIAILAFLWYSFLIFTQSPEFAFSTYYTFF